jgi:hypothetical protein
MGKAPKAGRKPGAPKESFKGLLKTARSCETLSLMTPSRMLIVIVVAPDIAIVAVVVVPAVEQINDDLNLLSVAIKAS